MTAAAMANATSSAASPMTPRATPFVRGNSACVMPMIETMTAKATRIPPAR